MFRQRGVANLIKELIMSGLLCPLIGVYATRNVPDSYLGEFMRKKIMFFNLNKILLGMGWPWHKN